MTDQPGQEDSDKITINGDGNVIGNNNRVTVIKNSSPAQLTSLHQIRSPLSDFTGRDDDIRRILAEFDKKIAVLGLFGMGGVGKTDLALVIADKLKTDFPDAQFFIDMRGTSESALTPWEAMAQVIHSYDATFRLPDNQSTLQGQYISVLQGKRALILLDNAASREQVESLLPPSSCCLLITSRYKFALKGMKAIDLDVLSLEDARQLLLVNADRIGDNAEKLAELCGRLPLALRNAAYVLAERVDLDVAEYIDRLKDARKRLDLVYASFELSYNLLAPDLREKWSMLSIFPSDFDRDGGAAVWSIDLERVVDDLGELVRWSLVNFYPAVTPAEGRYRLHDLAHLFTGSHLNPMARIDGQLRHAEYYKDLLSKANSLYLEGGPGIQSGLALFDREWANIQAGWAWAERNLQGISAAASLCSSYPDAGAYVLNLRLHPKERIRWLETAVAAARQQRDRGAEGVHLGNLGIAYKNLGEPRKAINYYQQALAISREKEDRTVEGNWLGNLGLAYADLGEPHKAIEHYDQALKMSREIGDRKGESAPLGNLGNAYAALGEPLKAIEYYQQALSISREIGDRRGEGTDLGNLGIAYAGLGEPHKAIEHYGQAFKISQEIGDRKGVGAHLGNLGLAYAALGEPRKAIEHYQQQLKITQEIGDRRGEATALFNMSLALDDLDRRSEAIKLAEDALAIFDQIESPVAERLRLLLAEWQGFR